MGTRCAPHGLGFSSNWFSAKCRTQSLTTSVIYGSYRAGIAGKDPQIKPVMSSDESGSQAVGFRKNLILRILLVKAANSVAAS